MSNNESALMKVFFSLSPDEDGYLPVGSESLWAKVVKDGYQIDNIPFYVTGVSCYDVVAVNRGNDGTLSFSHVVKRFGHSTIRVCICDVDAVGKLRRDLKALGYESEQDYVPNLIAIDIAPHVKIRPLWEFLEEGLEQSKWEYEDACIQHEPS
jgi:hypothetical protein